MGDARSRRCFTEIMSGVEYLHGLGVVHCDIKLDKVLIDKQGTCKMADFGLAHVFPRDTNGKVLRSLLTNKHCESCSYNAPEIMCKRVDPAMAKQRRVHRLTRADISGLT